MRNSRDTVNSLQVASPCSMSWEEMEGDSKMRYCKSCRLNVFNISEMDVEEAAELIANSTDRLCVRLYRRRDGTVLTQDCPVGFRAAVRRRMAAFAGSLAVGVGMLTSLVFRPAARQAPAPPTADVRTLPPPEPENAVMGAVAIELPTPKQREAPEVLMGDAIVGQAPRLEVRQGRIALPVVQPTHRNPPHRR